MNEPRFRWIIALSLVAGAWWFGRAQGQPPEKSPAGPASTIAIVDVQRIFVESPRLKRLVEDLKQDLELEGADAKQMGDALNKLKAQFDGLPQGSDERNVLRTEMEKRAAEFKKTADALKADFTAREAEMYSRFYDDVAAEIQSYAKANGIRLVLRFKTPENLPQISGVEDARKAVQDINQLIVYHDNFDITDAMIERLKATGAY